MCVQKSKYGTSSSAFSSRYAKTPTSKFRKIVQQHTEGMVGSTAWVLLEIYRDFQQWRKFENALRIDKVIAVCVCIRPSVCLSVTFVDCVKTSKHVIKTFSPSGSQAILVFPNQTAWQYSDGNIPNGDVECRWSRLKFRFFAIGNCCTVVIVYDTCGRVFIDCGYWTTKHDAL